MPVKLDLGVFLFKLMRSLFKQCTQKLNLQRAKDNLLHFTLLARFPPSKRVKVFCDSENAWKIISIGSSKPHLQNIAIDIFNLCLENPFEIEAQWLPREQNQIADQLSRFVDKATAPLITKFLRHLMHSGVLIRQIDLHLIIIIRYQDLIQSLMCRILTHQHRIGVVRIIGLDLLLI